MIAAGIQLLALFENAHKNPNFSMSSKIAETLHTRLFIKKTCFPEGIFENDPVDRVFENFSAKKTLILCLLREETGIRILK